MRCGWCDVHNPSDRQRCVGCGGPLPLVAGTDPGPMPPAAPRELPAIFVRRVMFDRNFGVKFGVAFAAVGGAGSLFFLGLGCVVPLMWLGLPITLLFLAIGAGIARAGRREGLARVALLRSGAATLGRVEEVQEVAPQGGEPVAWRVAYRYEVDGRELQGEVRCTDAEVTRLGAGRPLHVVYLRETPEQSDVWPLLA